MSEPQPPLDATARACLDAHASALASLAVQAAHPHGGFGALGPDNELLADAPVEAYINARMTHVLAVEVLRGSEDLRPWLDTGIAGFRGALCDQEYGGWFDNSTAATDKTAYTHAFVTLAATSLVAACHPRGQELLTTALDVINTRFWDDRAGMAVEQWDRRWARLDEYRGINANMHMTEAFLAVWDVTGERVYLDRAHRIVERVVHGYARQHDWRLPEHFTSQWHVQRDYNSNEPAHQFRPYGVTIGHLLEWSRLTLNLRNALGADAPGWMLADAEELFTAATARGWAVDGAPGFVYTTGFDDKPIVRERLHWVVCEGIAAAWTLYEATGNWRYREWWTRLWAYADQHLIDSHHGGWIHELSPTNTPSQKVWHGKPDIYHAYQATLVPLLPQAVSFAGFFAK